MMSETKLIVTDTGLCVRCSENEAEVFQDTGNFCLTCWQEITHTDVSSPENL